MELLVDQDKSPLEGPAVRHQARAGAVAAGGLLAVAGVYTESHHAPDQS